MTAADTGNDCHKNLLISSDGKCVTQFSDYDLHE